MHCCPLWVPFSGAEARPPLSTLDKRWVAAVVLNRDMGPVVCLPLLGELHAAALSAPPPPRSPLLVADIGH